MSDPTQYKMRKSKETSIIKKRASSAPTPVENNVYKTPIVDPPVITYGEYNGTKIILFGEIHSSIDNRFYENLNLRDNIVFVEHASILCDMTMEHKKRLLNILKGSEWIWYKYSARKRPVVCLDNRIEIGLPTSMEEKYALNSNDLSEVMMYCMKALRIIITPEIKRKFITALIMPIYTTSVKTIKEQMDILIKNANLNTDELMDIKWKLIQNITKLSGMIVDLNVMDHIKQQTESQNSASKKKDIYIFMGAAHAYRLQKFFPEIFTNIVYNTSDPGLIESMQTLTYE